MINILLFLLNRSSLPFSGPQSKNARIKKRGVISSAWLEKCKPKLIEDTDHNVDSLKENASESEDIHCDEEMFTPEKTNLDRENTCNTLSTNGNTEISYSIKNDNETSQNSFHDEERNTKKDSPDIELKPNSPQSVADEGCQRDDKPVVTSKCKEREGEKHPVKDPHLMVSYPHEPSKKSCKSSSDFVSISKPIMPNTLEDNSEESRDSPPEITRNKRKAAGNETTELEKPCKKLRCENNVDEVICEESKG